MFESHCHHGGPPPHSQFQTCIYTFTSVLLLQVLKNTHLLLFVSSQTSRRHAFNTAWGQSALQRDAVNSHAMVGASRREQQRLQRFSCSFTSVVSALDYEAKGHARDVGGVRLSRRSEGKGKAIQDEKPNGCFGASLQKTSRMPMRRQRPHLLTATDTAAISAGGDCKMHRLDASCDRTDLEQVNATIF